MSRTRHCRSIAYRFTGMCAMRSGFSIASQVNQGIQTAAGRSERTIARNAACAD